MLGLNTVCAVASLLVQVPGQVEMFDGALVFAPDPGLVLNTRDEWPVSTEAHRYYFDHLQYARYVSADGVNSASFYMHRFDSEVPDWENTDLLAERIAGSMRSNANLVSYETTHLLGHDAVEWVHRYSNPADPRGEVITFRIAWPWSSLERIELNVDCAATIEECRVFRDRVVASVVLAEQRSGDG